MIRTRAPCTAQALPDKCRDNGHIAFDIVLCLAVAARLLAEPGWNLWSNGEDVNEGLFSESPCRFLNITDQYQRLKMSCLVKRIKKNGAYVEEDPRGEKRLNQKDWRALSDEEIAYYTGCRRQT